MKDGNTVEFTATLNEKANLKTSFDSNDNLHDICYFVDNICARLQELKSAAILKVIYGDKQPDININITKPVKSIPPREQFFIDPCKIETLRRTNGTSYVRCIVRLVKNPDVLIVHELELDDSVTEFEHAKQLIVADVDKHVTSICEQLHKNLLNDEFGLQEEQ